METEKKKAFIVHRGVLVRLYVADKMVQEYTIDASEAHREAYSLSRKGFDIKESVTY